MAGEYSRELSVKVSRAHRQQAALSFHRAGPQITACGGRSSIRTDDKLLLQSREAKSLNTDKVILVRGPDNEVQVIQDIFRLFNEERRSFKKIAELLNMRGTKTTRGKPWRKENIATLLRSEKYAGTFVFGMTKWPMRGPAVQIPKDKWIRVENFIEPVVDRETYEKAQLLLKDGPNFSDNELLDYLSSAWCVLGHLSAPLIDECGFAPTHHTYREKFGALTNAYNLIGYRQIDSFRYTHAPTQLRVIHRRIIESLFPSGIASIPRLATISNDKFYSGQSLHRCCRPAKPAPSRPAAGRLGPPFEQPGALRANSDCPYERGQ